jgi:hypothetical protein
MVNEVVTELEAAKTQLSFVEANWGKLSIIVIAAAAVGFLIGRLV